MAQQYVTKSAKQKLRRNFFKLLEQKIIVQIFSHLKSKERQRMREVCFTWKSIIDQDFGFRVENWKCFQPTESLMIFEVGALLASTFFHILPIVRYNCNLLTLIIDLRSTEMFRKRIKPIQPSCSDIMLRNNHKNNFLSDKILIFLDRRAWLPHLKKCRIICSDNVEGEDWQQIQMVYLVFHLLKNSPLEELEFYADGTIWELPLEFIFRIEIPRVNMFAQDVDTIQQRSCILRLAGRQLNTKAVPLHLLKGLQHLKFHNDYEVSLHFLGRISNQNGNTVSRRRRSQGVGPAGASLDSLAFRIGSGKNWLCKGWDQILLAQSHLTKLDYEFHTEQEMRKHVRKVLSSNYKTLKILKLYGTRESCYGMDSFDGGWFHGLTNLEHLELVGESTEDKIYLKNLLPMLVRPWNLPQSLRTLVVHGPIDCGKVSLGTALKHLSALRNLELLGRFHSPWFYSNWDPIFEIDSNFILNFHIFLPALRKWKLIYLKPQLLYYNGTNNQAMLKLDKCSWKYGPYCYTIQTGLVDAIKTDIIISRIKIHYNYDYM